MKLKYNFVVRNVAGRFVAVAIGTDGAKFKGMVNLNDTGAFIFEQLKNDITIEELIEKMQEKYEVTPEEALKTAESFVAKLQESGLISK